MTKRFPDVIQQFTHTHTHTHTRSSWWCLMMRTCVLHSERLIHWNTHWEINRALWEREKHTHTHTHTLMHKRSLRDWQCEDADDEVCHSNNCKHKHTHTQIQRNLLFETHTICGISIIMQIAREGVMGRLRRKQYTH